MIVLSYHSYVHQSFLWTAFLSSQSNITHHQVNLSFATCPIDTSQAFFLNLLRKDVSIYLKENEIFFENVSNISLWNRRRFYKCENFRQPPLFELFLTQQFLQYWNTVNLPGDSRGIFAGVIQTSLLPESPQTSWIQEKLQAFSRFSLASWTSIFKHGSLRSHQHRSA